MGVASAWLGQPHVAKGVAEPPPWAVGVDRYPHSGHLGVDEPPPMGLGVVLATPMSTTPIQPFGGGRKFF